MEYHLLKSIDHLPLALFVLQSNWKEGRIEDANLKKINAYKDIIAEVNKNLKKTIFNARLLKQQEDIINYSLNYLNTLVSNKVYVKSERDKFARTISTLLLNNSEEAARLELSNLHSQVSAWKLEMDTNAFKNLYVVIGSSHQARFRETTVQYFEKVLNEKIGSTALNENHIVYAESVYDEKACLSILARHIIDQEIGLAFFGDKFRMQRDLLSDGAANYINEIFPEKNSSK